MNYSAPFILYIIALIFTVCSFIWSGYPLLSVAVLLIAIAGLLTAHS